MSKTYDIVIAGAGPAGSAAAIRLQQMNFKVCLIDDVEDSKLKVGESIPGAVQRMLYTLGIQSLDSLLSQDEYIKSAANVSAWGTDEWVFNDAILNPEGGGWHILRNRFDTKLRDKAKESGIDFYHAKLGKVIRETTGYKVKFNTQKKELPNILNTKWLIDASGRASVILKQFGIKRNPCEEQMAAICWLKSIDGDTDATTRVKSVENGWWYSTKLPDKSRVIAFHGLITSVAIFNKKPDLFIDRINEVDFLPFKVREENLQDEKIVIVNAGVSKPDKITGDNWLAVGDAALSFDPISSQGIYFALYSGIRGAEAISKILKSEKSDTEMTLQAYSAKIDEVHKSNMRSRKYFYTQELRYTSNPYWSQYLH